METNSKHLLLELFECDKVALSDLELVKSLLEKAANAAGVHIVQSVFHEYSPQGVTGIVVIEESHLSIHTWPEHAYASVDFFTCGEGSLERAQEIIVDALKAKRIEAMLVDRGQSIEKQAMKVRYHN